MTDPPEATYIARRFPLTIRVTITGDQVHWVYRYWANEWREQLPLDVLIAYPMRFIHGNERPGRIGVGGILAVLGIVLLVLAREPWWLAVAAGVLLVIGLAVAIAVWWRLPLEWAVFDSILPGKSIYFFCGRDRDEFERFVGEFQSRVPKQASSDREEARRE